MRRRGGVTAVKFRIRIVTFFVPFFLFVTIASAAGPDLDKQEKALNIIADFADRLCKTVPLEGTNQKLELSGGARAELNEVLKKIAELGIEGAAQYQTSEYQG